MTENGTWRAIDAYELIFGKLDLGSFQRRLLFQKTIYFLKLLGVQPFKDLNYTWYKRGPYCFELGGIYRKIYPDKIYLTSEEKESVLKHKKIISALISDEKSSELNSSVAYLVYDEKLSDVEVIKRIALTKPWFEQKDVELALLNIKEIFKIA